MGWSIAVCPSPCHEVDAESAHRVDAQWLLVDRGATIGNDHQHSESDDHYPSSRIFLALRSGGSGGTHCLVEVAMLLRPPQVQLARTDSHIYLSSVSHQQSHSICLSVLNRAFIIIYLSIEGNEYI